MPIRTALRKVTVQPERLLEVVLPSDDLPEAVIVAQLSERLQLARCSQGPLVNTAGRVQ